MTKPANFPERKRMRQIRALFRLRSLHPARRPKDEILGLEAATLQGDQRNVRTKKNRSDRAKLIRG